MNSTWCDKDHCNEDDHETKMISGRSSPLVKLQSDARACDRLFAPGIRSLAWLVYPRSIDLIASIRAIACPNHVPSSICYACKFDHASSYIGITIHVDKSPCGEFPSLPPTLKKWAGFTFP